MPIAGKSGESHPRNNMMSPSTAEKKTLAIDLRCLPLDGSPGAGIAHASRALASALHRTAPPDWQIDAYTCGDPLLDPNISRVSLKSPRVIELIKALNQNKPTALFSPTGSAPPFLKIPAIPWIHDLDILDHPEWFPESRLKRFYTTSIVKRGLKKAPVVFTVSEYTKEQIERLASIPEEKIMITKESGDPEWENIEESELLRLRAEITHSLRVQEIGGAFVLMLGTIEPRKNHEFILKIWRQISTTYPHVQLIIAGKRGWKTDEFDRALSILNQPINHHIPSVICLEDVDDDLRKALLLSAQLVLVPSKSEGFGLVALESAQVRTPVLTSDKGALPEVLGRGMWTLPLDEKEWKETILDLLEQKNEREVMADQQYGIARELTWNAVARTVWTGLNENVERRT